MKLDFTAYRHPVLTAPCATCHAVPGTMCRRPSGHRASDFHKSRKADADAAFVAQHGPLASIERDGTAWQIVPGGRLRYEPTREGLQAVIPGCERQTDPRDQRQGVLF